MLTKFIASSYEISCEVAIWLTLLGGFIGGWFAGGFVAAIGGLTAAFIVCIVIFGAFLALVDIQESVRAVKDKQTLCAHDPMLPRTCTISGRRAALFLVVVVASGGMGVTPAVAASGSTCNSYNPTLFKTGTTYKIVTKNSYVGAPPYTSDADVKVMGFATYHGHKLIHIHHHVLIAYPVTKISTTSDDFYKIGGTSIYYYGSRGQSGGESYSDPPMSNPKQYVINVPYTAISAIHTSGNGTTESSSPRHVTTTFLGMESITVPAGTFTACKMKEEIFSESGKKPSISYNWNVSSGRYAGLDVKGDYYSPTGSSIGKMVALSLQVNGK